MRDNNDAFERCAELISQADGLLVTAGAGMGVDAGLPDFRGDNGFWRSYPALAKSGIVFEDIASPQTFLEDPALAWGFYGHRLDLYRRTEPHEGYRLLLKWGMTLPKGVFVFTSNVDGLFQRAGFDDTRVSECHGSIHQLQCLRPCSDEIWPADKVIPQVDESACRLLSPLPRCPRCGAIARPNILMFGDSGWIETRWLSQNARLYDWLGKTKSFVVIELGAGKHIPTVREFGQSICHKHACPMIRINPTEPDLGPLSGISLPMRALAALRGIGGSLDAVSPIE